MSMVLVGEPKKADELPPFQSFQSIPRLKRACVISEKIDGTNAQIYIPDHGLSIYAGSRNRWITPGDDNYGFASWVEENREELLKLGPGYHFGEWWGSGIQRRYGLSEKRFSLFNTGRWGSGADTAQLPSCCSVVPVLYSGPFSTEQVDKSIEGLRACGSVAAPGFMNPEGAVIYLAASRQLFKVTLDGDGHKANAKNSHDQKPAAQAA